MSGIASSLKDLLDRLCPACRARQLKDLAGEPVECGHLVRCRNWRTHGRCKECAVATEDVARLLERARKMASTVLLRDREVEDFLKDAEETLRRLREGRDPR